MRQFIPALFLLYLCAGCKKAVEDIQEDLVIRAMTDGQWAISSFTLNGSDITADYYPYRFKYHSNRTVDAIRNGTVERTGNWSGDAAAMTTWAQFNGSSYPLTLINGTWNILRNGWTYVEARQISGTDIKLMRLDKQ
ncbi:MAG: hypothetical protein RJA57_508 [Bacteroidota bacterium]|jgi:hypothetical protein